MKNQLGFSLVEIAVVLVIIAILVTAIGIPLATQIDQQRNTETQKQLETIKEAIYGYAMANGRLPCPATDGIIYGATSSNGAEGFTGTNSPATGICSSFVGLVPAVTLGLAPVDANGFAVDAWGLTQNRIRYAVRGLTIAANTPAACTTASTNPLTANDGMRNATMGCLSSTNASINLLSICSTTPLGTAGASTGCASVATTLTSKAPFLLISLGKNAPTGAAAGSDELHNVDADYFFVSRTPTAVGATGGEFDDIVTWGNLNTLFARMVKAERLP